MMIGNLQVVVLILEAFSVIAAVAGVTAWFLMHQTTKKFGTGILASGFKRISTGVAFIAGGLMIDAVNLYLQLPYNNMLIMSLFLLKGLAFLFGTYIIVIGSKTTTDKLESLMR